MSKTNKTDHLNVQDHPGALRTLREKKKEMVRKSLKGSLVLVQGREKNVLGVVPGRQNTAGTDGVRTHHLTAAPDIVPRPRGTENQDTLHVDGRGHRKDTGEGEEEEEADALKQDETYLRQTLITKMKDVREG
jgi:hypothetical protein